MPCGEKKEVVRVDDTSMPPQKKRKVSESSAGNSVNEEGTNPGDLIQDSTPTPLYEDHTYGDWRWTNCVRRNHYALKNNLLCDVKFEVGKEESKRRSFHAHRLILALASPVFEAMFYGQVAEKGDSITITDIEPEGFEALLRYIYTDEVVGQDNFDCLFQLWIAADKYCIPRIKVDCEEYFDLPVLSPSNVWIVLQTGLFLDIETVVVRCRNYLTTYTEASLLSEDFTNINLETMKDFLDLELFSTKEILLLSALVKWGEVQKKYSLKKTVEPCIKLIHFGSLTALEFCQFLDMTNENVMSDGDALSILKHLVDPQSFPLPSWCPKKSRLSFYDTYLESLKAPDSDSTSDSSNSSTDSSNSSAIHTEEDNHRLD